MWMVHYTVTMPPYGTAEHSAGPYPFDEAIYQKTDIEGYTGVSNVRLIPVVGNPSEATE